MTADLSVRGARVRPGGAETLLEVALDSLDVAPGGCVALTGPSGAGKTTLMELLGLVRRPDELGEYQLGGWDLTELARSGDIAARARLRAETIAYVPQSGGVLPFLDARGNGLAGLDARGGFRSAAARERLEREARTLGVDAALGRRRAELSGGERRRVGLLRALADPRTLTLADEPTSALDPATADRVLARLAEFAAETGGMVIIVTHDGDRARRHGFAMHDLRADASDGDLRRLVPV
ncbi:ATP-binding cassette domain-containing protein [Albimonas sp. CAU 1670]|uniref:ABC transporter ATP-binding protein n=1 Tax=Albimonas sp. CAU 1670 TaxID=3032599 RepID=UPI0023D9B4BC|nr:ATP-binding cassette domain-containing protein [Albimonas sp. CAU 1670]MDF2235884.1 ATP-binding cassette domain-containing protein [Albimonas sp. CAU 1670]